MSINTNTPKTLAFFPPSDDATKEAAKEYRASRVESMSLILDSRPQKCRSVRR
jgi:hypothetical protein